MKSKMMKVLVCAMAVAMLAGCSSKGGSSSATTTTYTGTSSNGFGGDVVVTITVNDETKEILSVESAGEKETEAVGGAALETLDANFLAAQSAEFDGVSGATITSDAYKEAVADALAQMNGGKVEEESSAVEDGSSAVEEESSKAEEESSSVEEESSSVEEESSKAE